MKQYVLDEPMAAAPPPVEPRARSLTRLAGGAGSLLAILLESIALALLYVVLNGVPGPSPAAPSRGVADVASFSFPREARGQRRRRSGAAPPQRRSAASDQERGRYVVELHAGAGRRARDAGRGDRRRRVRRQRHLHRQRAPADAIGRRDVAARGVASGVRRRRQLRHRLCAGSACDVRFVSLAKPGAPVPRPEALQAEVAETEPATAPAFAPPAQAPVDQAAAAAQSILNGNGAPAEN